MERAFLEQGDYEFRQGKYQAAVSSYRQAIARNPQSIEAHYSCGLAAEKLGRQQLAQECFTSVVKLRAESDSDNIVLSDPSAIETTSRTEVNGDKPQANSVLAGIGFCCFLLTVILRTVVFIGYVAEQTTSHSSPHVNSQAAEVIDLVE